MPTFTTFIQHSIGSPSQSSQARKKKVIQIGKEKIKLSQFADDMILYVENPKDSQKTARTNKCSKVLGYKINIQKSVAFLYTNNKLTQT